MHEVGLMQTALRSAFKQAAQHRAVRIHRLTLSVGKLSGVVPEALRFAFEVVTRGTPAEGAELIVHEVPVVCRCETCNNEFKPADLVFVCPHCGAVSATWNKGQELELTSIEVS